MENQDPKTKEFGPKGHSYESDKKKFLGDCQKELRRALVIMAAFYINVAEFK